MKSTVYIETSIPSFYHETREGAEFVAMRNWTRKWWNSRKGLFQCFTSSAALDELEDGNHPRRAEKIHLLDELEFLEINDDIKEIVKVYISNYVMPKDVLGDALHLAIASFHKIDYLLTWNCNHLANANKKKHIRRINERLRLATPEIITPLELLKDRSMPDNETIREIRETRRKISARFGHSPKRLIEYYKEKQKTGIQSNRPIETARRIPRPDTAR